MKTLFTFALALGIQLATFAMSPNDQLAAHSRVTSSNQKITITLLQGIGKVKISVLDEKGMNLLTNFIKINENVVYPINMENLPEGNYMVRISNKEGVIEQWVKLSPKIKKERKTTAVIKVLNDQQLQIGIKKITGDLTLKMFNEDHRILMKEDIKGQYHFTKIYTLQNIDLDKVYFNLTDKLGNQLQINQ